MNVPPLPHTSVVMGCAHPQDTEQGRHAGTASAAATLVQPSPMSKALRILFVSVHSDPASLSGVAGEADQIREQLYSSELRGNFELQQHWQASAAELPTLIMRLRPQILHLSGHGDENGLCFWDPDGRPKTIDPHSLTPILESLGGVQCVILNACHTSEQAESIAQHIDVVIGMSNAIEDRAALEFTAGFYAAVGHRQDLSTAFEVGRVRSGLSDQESPDGPVLFARPGVDASRLFVPALPRGSGALSQRFSAEPGGRRRLEQTLSRQPIVAGDPRLAASLALVSQVQSFPANGTLIEQGGADNDIYFILVGTVEVLVNGTPVATRQAGQHVGEMTLIDPTQLRSATVRSLEELVLARVTEEDFAALANQYPVLWRRLALELGMRLRQRGRLLPPTST